MNASVEGDSEHSLTVRFVRQPSLVHGLTLRPITRPPRANDNTSAEVVNGSRTDSWQNPGKTSIPIAAPYCGANAVMPSRGITQSYVTAVRTTRSQTSVLAQGMSILAKSAA